jgi:hypothetical protein
LLVEFVGFRVVDGDVTDPVAFWHVLCSLCLR